MIQRMVPDERKICILDAGITCAIEQGYTCLTRFSVAMYAGCTPALISHYYGTLEEFKTAVIQEAISRPEPKIVAEAILQGHPLMSDISEELRVQAANYIIKER